MNKINLTSIPNCCGIYKFTNIITGKVYIGSAINLRKRIQIKGFKFKYRDDIV